MNIKAFIKQLTKHKSQLDIETNLSQTLLAATDNSIYQVLPSAIVYPKNEHAIQMILQIANQPQFQHISFAMRGAGTGTNGQSLSHGIIIDTTRYLHEILHIDAQKKSASIQPGVVLSQLNDALKSYDLFFAPHISTANRATLGGMINTDACGQGSRIYGRTSDHIYAMKGFLMDGSPFYSQKINLTKQNLKQHPNRPLYQALNDLVSEHTTSIHKHYNCTEHARHLTGYNLAKFKPDNTALNMNYLLAGSEGTLAIITEIEVQLTTNPKQKHLYLTFHEKFSDALTFGYQLLAFEPTAIETIDHHILQLAKENEIYTKIAHLIPQDSMIGSINFIELHDPAIEDVQALSSLLQKIPHQLIACERDAESCWELRKKGVGLLASLPGHRQPIPFMEDTIVPPKHLSAYIEEITLLLQKHNLIYGMFGHIDVGCLHIRPALDMTVESDRQKIAILTAQVSRLVKKYGGHYCGEHGKGFRSELIPEYFGPILYKLFKDIKFLFDPLNRLNPGKIVNFENTYVKIDGPFRGYEDEKVPLKKRQSFESAFKCNGNAACLNFDTSQVICPSAKVSRNWLHSPKGRSSILREYLKDSDNTQVIQQTFQALETCLGCKACQSSCPVKVNIPQMKAKFLAQYYQSHRRPSRDHLLASLETHYTIPLRWPRLSQFFFQNSIAKFILKHCFQLTNLPKYHSPSFLQLKKQFNIKDSRTPTIAILMDITSLLYQPNILIDTYQLLEKLGLQPTFLPFIPSGKALHDLGFTHKFKQLIESNHIKLKRIFEQKIPILGIEPSLIITFRDEYKQYFPPNANPFQIQLFQEWFVQYPLDTSINLKIKSIPSTKQAVQLLAHCSEKALISNNTTLWKQVFKCFQVDLHLPETGCCGMAGQYGHTPKYIKNSKKLYEMSWKTHVNQSDIITLATGFSCRCQIDLQEASKIQHPIQFLNQLLHFNQYFN